MKELAKQTEIVRVVFNNNRSDYAPQAALRFERVDFGGLLVGQNGALQVRTEFHDNEAAPISPRFWQSATLPHIAAAVIRRPIGMIQCEADF